MKRKYFKYHFFDTFLDLVYELDGRDENETLEKVRKYLRAKGHTDMKLKKEMKS